MSTYTNKMIPYLEQYKKFIGSKKVYTVKFSKEHFDSSRNVIKNDIVEEKTFSDIETALKYADEIQDKILEEEKKRYIEIYNNSEPNDIYWMSEIKYEFNNKNNHSLISAYINWGRSEYVMDLTYSIIDG